jgi:hypothetical protein
MPDVLIYKTINSDQFSEANTLILAVHKVLTEPGNFVSKYGFVDILDAGRFR